jgi:hypothetical protein
MYLYECRPESRSTAGKGMRAGIRLMVPEKNRDRSTEFILSEVEVLTMTPQLEHF